jgi:hypothetical protein
MTMLDTSERLTAQLDATSPLGAVGNGVMKGAMWVVNAGSKWEVFLHNLRASDISSHCKLRILHRVELCRKVMYRFGPRRVKVLGSGRTPCCHETVALAGLATTQTRGRS